MVLSITKHTVPKVHFHYLVWLRNNWIHFLTSAILQGVRANVFRSYNKVSLPYREIGELLDSDRRAKGDRNGIRWPTERGRCLPSLSSLSLSPPPPPTYTILASEGFLWMSYQISVYKWNVRCELVSDDGLISYSILLLYIAGNGRCPWCTIFRQIR